MDAECARGQTLMSASRNNWLAGVLKLICAELGVSSLDSFLDGERPSAADRSGYHWVMSELDQPMIEAALAGISDVLRTADEQPQLVVNLVGVGFTSLEDVKDALRSTTADYDPVHGPKGEEEGDGPYYLFAYLKSLQALLRHADRHGLSVIHAKSVP